MRTEEDLPDTRECIAFSSECYKLLMELFVQTAEDSGIFRDRMPPDVQNEFQLFGLGSRNVDAWNNEQKEKEQSQNYYSLKIYLPPFSRPASAPLHPASERRRDTR